MGAARGLAHGAAFVAEEIPKASFLWSQPGSVARFVEGL
jgi:hypothetical protein